MSTLMAEYRDAIGRLPPGATLIVQQVEWEEYERLLDDLAGRPDLRLSYDHGRLEVMTPLAEHEAHARFVDDLVRIVAEHRGLLLEKRGSATWKRRALARGVEADACCYVANARHVIGKRTIDLDVDPPPDLVVEIDITNESMGKRPTYAALGVPEIWRYDGTEVSFHGLVEREYRPLSNSLSFPGLRPDLVGDALAQSMRDGQTAALRTFQNRLRSS